MKVLVFWVFFVLYFLKNFLNRLCHLHFPFLPSISSPQSHCQPLSSPPAGLVLPLYFHYVGLQGPSLPPLPHPFVSEIRTWRHFLQGEGRPSLAIPSWQSGKMSLLSQSSTVNSPVSGPAPEQTTCRDLS